MTINPELDTDYISKNWNDPDSFIRKVRILGESFETSDDFHYAKIKKEIVLQQGKGNKYSIQARYSEITEGVYNLSIQRFTNKTGNPHSSNISLDREGITKLFNLICDLELATLGIPLNLKNKSIFDASIEELKEIGLTKEQLDYIHHKIIKDSKYINSSNLEFTDSDVKNHLHKHPEVLLEAIKTLTTEDIIAIGYRKKQLSTYSKLLDDEAYFNEIQNKIFTKENKKISTEGIWQRFFEKNTWIFGYGLNFLFNTPLKDKKLEQMVKGNNAFEAGKRADALLKTQGIISSLCFLEIKTHETLLLKQVKSAYRVECWAISDELSGAIAQVQKTVQVSLKNIKTKTETKEQSGELTGEEIYLYEPKSYLVIGSLSEFLGEHGVNEDKFSSFEIFRRNITNPEIITFDELYSRAKYIVDSSDEN